MTNKEIREIKEKIRQSKVDKEEELDRMYETLSLNPYRPRKYENN